MSPPCFEGYSNRGIHKNHTGMSFDDGIWKLNAKVDMLIHLVEQKMNVNDFNFVVYVLCEEYHANYQCVQS